MIVLNNSLMSNLFNLKSDLDELPDEIQNSPIKGSLLTSSQCSFLSKTGEIATLKQKGDQGGQAPQSCFLMRNGLNLFTNSS